MPRMHPSIKFAHVQKPVEEVEMKSCLNRDQYDQHQKPNEGCFKCDNWRDPICIGLPPQTFPECHKDHRNEGPQNVVQYLITKEKGPHICGHRTQKYLYSSPYRFFAHNTTCRPPAMIVIKTIFRNKISQIQPSDSVLADSKSGENQR